MSKTIQANPSEFPEPQRESPSVQPFPSSKNKKFWGKDADINLVNTNEIPRLTPDCGDFKQKGPFVICGKCPNSHTVPGVTLNTKGELVRVENLTININSH